ncbi:glycerophosphodiester phosphodiesterase [Intestinimonas sp. HCP28S3_D6]|uniref:glycerophosphodiester phosphodiesterase n=1 Tax=Intestinimonas sp. HCP28S3_D6 TaxID=3438942 RepID=UPI003F888BEF
MSKVRALTNLLCGSCLALLLLPVGAQAAGRLEIQAPDRLPLGAEQVLELDGGTRNLDGAETVTVSGYLEEDGTVPALTVGGQVLEADGETQITLEFEKGEAALPVMGGAVGNYALSLEAGGRTGTVSLEVVSALEEARSLVPDRITVSVSKDASAFAVRTAIAEQVEKSIATSGFTAAGGKVRVTGEEQKGFSITLTGEGQMVTLPTKVSIYRRDASGQEVLENQLKAILTGDFSFETAEEITAESIANQAAAMVGDEKTTVTARWNEEEGCWYVALKRQGQELEAPLYLNSRVDLAFDSPALLNRCGIRLAVADDVYVAGGTLNTVGVAGNGYEAVVFPIWNYGRDFCIQAEVRINDAMSGSRWCGLAFGVQAAGGTDTNSKYSFWQLALRQDPTASNGVECARMLPGGAWSTQCAAPLSTAMEEGQVYTLTILYQNGVVCQYVDGALVLRADVADQSTVDGQVAFTFDGATAELLSLSVTDQLPDLPTEEPLTANGYDTQIYEPKTGLVMSPTVVAEGDSLSASDIAAGERRPATLIKEVFSDLTVVDRGTRISLNSYVDRLDKRVLAGFRIEDLTTAAAFAQYVSVNGIVDVNVFSSQLQVLQTACAGKPGVRAILDCSDMDLADPRSAAALAGRAGARVVVLDQADASPETVAAIQTRGVAVWVRTDGGEAAYYTAILSGADGLVTDGWEGVMDAIESFPAGQRTLTRTPVITAHRGLHETAPENTERSAILAAEAGTDAIECDVHLSADGVVMVNHDSTTGALTNQNLWIAAATRLQLQSLTFRDKALAGDRMPTLAQLFQAVQGRDTVFLVEIKSEDPAIIEPLVQTVYTAGMTDRVVFLSYSTEQLQRIRARMPEAAVGYLAACTQSGADTAANLKAMAEVLDPLCAFYSCPQEAQTTALTRAARHRGILIHPWTVDEYELFEQKYYDGYHGITTDHPDYASYYLTGAEAVQTEADFQSGQEGGGALQVVRRTRCGSETVNADCFLQIGGDAVVEMDDTGRLFSQTPGNAVVLLGSTATLPATQVPYRMYTGPVTLTFAE